MAGHASKRRKLEHASSEGDEDDSASFASLDDAEADGQEDGDGLDAEELDPAANGDDRMDGMELEGEEDDDQQDDHHGGSEGFMEGVQPHADVLGSTRTAQSSTRVTADTKGHRGASVSQSSSYAAGTFKSSLLKLQVDELLEQIRPRRGKREIEAEATLQTLKQAIEKIPSRESTLAGDAEKALLKSSRVRIPFPSPRPSVDAKYKLAYERPSSINVVGSHALRSASRAKKYTEIDMIVVMPASLLQEKDYLDYRYFYKRSYYLACIAAGLESAGLQDVNVRFSNFHGNPLHPVILVTPMVFGHGGVNVAPQWQINILPSAPEEAFSPEKLLLNRCCVRQRGEASSEILSIDNTRTATPFYNSSLRMDMLATPYLQLCHQAAKKCDAFRDACLLATTWLRQRGLGSDMQQGGFGSFEFSALIALLLQNGGSGGRPALSDRYTSYQLFKATLQALASKDISKQPLIIGESATLAKVVPHGTPVVWDSIRSHNLLYRMTVASYGALKQEARTTLPMLADSTFDAFDSTFILRADSVLYRYDYVIEIDDSAMMAASAPHDHLTQDAYGKLHGILQKGLGDRVRHMNIIPPKKSSWDPKASRLNHNSEDRTTIAIAVNPDTVNRAVDHGPSAEQKAEAAAFRKFWLGKSELRRFKDGSILETVVWSNDRPGPSILEQIVRYVLRTHMGEAVEEFMSCTGAACTKLLRAVSDNSAFAATISAFKQFESDVRKLEGLPLSVRQISPSDSQLRYSATGSKRRPADVVLQFEGSTRWPDDLVAIQRTKIAFLLKLSEQMEESIDGVTARIGLENEGRNVLNQAFLDVVYASGAAFRIRIHHDRERTLLERRLKDKAIEPSVRDAAVYGLAKYKQDYIVGPAHTQAFAGLCGRHPALSGTVRLVKQWFASHLLYNHVGEEVIELIVARTFVQPWPWSTPSSVQTGFYRTLNWLSRWDWRYDSLIVDLSGGGDLNETQKQSIATNFEAWRKLDPALNRVVLFAASNVDPGGVTWTDGRPMKVIAGRMNALAKAARAEIEHQQLNLDPASLFESALSDFDFVLHIDPFLLDSKRRKSKKGAFKNLELQLDETDAASSFDPLTEYMVELERLYGSAVLFFSGGMEKPSIAGLWNPQTAARAWTLNLSYSTTPLRGAESEKDQAVVNKDAILAEIARLGGDMVKKIEVNKP